MPLELEVETTGISALSKKLHNLGLFQSDERDDIYTHVLGELGHELVTRLRQNTPQGTSKRLARSTSFHITIETNPETNVLTYSLVITQSAQSLGFTYRPIVVTGRGPGKMPPPLALMGWVELKWGLRGAEIAKGAFRLSRHIAAFGTQSNDFVLRTVHEGEADITKAANNLGQNLIVSLMDF